MSTPATPEIVALDCTPLGDRLHRASGGWTLAQDDDEGVCVLHDAGFWCRFGPETWARLNLSPEACDFVTRLLVVAVARGQVGRLAVVGYTAIDGAWRPEATAITLEKRT